MTRSKRGAKQPQLFPMGDLVSRDDSMGVALGVSDEDPDAVWAEVMTSFARISVDAYQVWRDPSRFSKPLYWWLVVDTTPDYLLTP